MPVAEKPSAMSKREAAYTLIASFLGWTLDAFDFFVLVFVISAIAADFHRSVAQVAFTITATLAMRPVGALLFGWIADRYGRRGPLMINVVFFTACEVMSGLAPSYRTFLILRALYGVGMGGEWGVGAALAMEAAPAASRGLLSGLLQEGYAIGYLLDRAFHTHFLYIPFLILGAAGGLLQLIRQFLRDTRENGF